jgi:hypothetical protein
LSGDIDNDLDHPAGGPLGIWDRGRLKQVVPPIGALELDPLGLAALERFGHRAERAGFIEIHVTAMAPGADEVAKVAFEIGVLVEHLVVGVDDVHADPHIAQSACDQLQLGFGFPSTGVFLLELAAELIELP